MHKTHQSMESFASGLSSDRVPLDGNQTTGTGRSPGTPPRLPPKYHEAISPVVMTLLIGTHARYRGMHTWLRHHQAETPRALALDEHNSSQRGKASVHVMDVHSGHVWAHVPPVDGGAVVCAGTRHRLVEHRK